MKNISTTFEEAIIVRKGNNLDKTTRFTKVTFTPKDIFVGGTGNWKYKFKNITNLEINHNDASVVFETNETKVELFDAESSTWFEFSRALQKRWDKILGKNSHREEENAPVVVKKARSTKPLKVYGTMATRHRNILASAMANSAWSDDEMLIDKEDIDPIEEDSSDHDREDDKTDEDSKETHDSDGEATVLATFTDDEEGQEASISSPVRSTNTKRKKRIRKKFLNDDDESDDDLFDKAEMTIPDPSQRLVTPRANAFIDEDEEEEDLAPVQLETNQRQVSEFFQRVETKQTIKSTVGETTHFLKSFDARAKPSDTTNKASNFFKPHDAKPKSSPSASVNSIAPGIQVKLPSPTLSQTALRRDNADWIEQTKHTTPPRTPQRIAPPTPIKTPSRSISRHFALPKTNDDMEDIQNSSDEDNGPSHKRLRTTSRKRFIHRRSEPRRLDTADSILAFASTQTSPVKSPAAAAPAASIVPAPPVSRWKGLRNLGNTCYLNSSLQLLYTLQDFCSGLVGHGGPLARSITSIATQLQTTTLSSISPREIKDAVDAATDRFSGYEQRDAHEFLSDLIDRVHDELTEGEKDKNDTPVLTDEFFRMNVLVCLKCDSCGYERTMDEMYRHISIEVDRHDKVNEDDQDRPKWSVRDGLTRFFEPEQREVTCEKCKDGKTATQTLSVTSRPKALILHLKRFVVRERPRISRSTPISMVEGEEESKRGEPRSPPVEMIIQKNRDQVLMEERFKLDTFFPDQATLPSSYKLSGIIHHHGSTPSSGHYTADALRVVNSNNNNNGSSNNEEWVSFDDGLASPNLLNKILNCPVSQRTSYMLLYSLESKPLK